MGPIEQNEGPRKKLHLGLTDILYENHLRERGSWKEGYEGLWKLALLIIFRASVSFKPRKVVMFKHTKCPKLAAELKTSTKQILL